MKKLIAPAFCLSLLFTSAAAVASVNASQTVQSVAVGTDDRQVIKPEELPEPIKKTLATDDYKGWSVKEAALVKGTAADAESYYEVTLAKEKETKTFKFQKDGTVMK